jgi:hypothetical protein
MVWVIEAKYIKDYVLRITFNDGVQKYIDFQSELDEGVFIPLKDKEYFKKFHISANTVEWENGADFAPEYLLTIGEMQI